MSKIIFINYRRIDSAPSARLLRENLIEAFGEAVFMDVDDVRVGDTWPETLNNALNSASVLLVVIGPRWLQAVDDHWRRRLDQPNDWVRTEIETSFRRGIPVIPILVDRGSLPSKEGMPEAIRDLLSQQSIELRDTHWKVDLEPLIKKLSDPPLEFQRRGDPVPVPVWPAGTAPDYMPRALTLEELKQELAALPNWKEITSPLPGQYPKQRTELTRRFKLSSFEEAIRFMLKAVPHMNQVKHHPRWENFYKTVTVWLSTWDNGHVVSKLDCDLARYLDDLYAGWNDPNGSPPPLTKK